MSVIFHADDFGITRSATQGILSAWADDALDRFGIMANGRHLVWGCRLLSTMNHPPLRLSIHLDVLEGCPLSNPSSTPLLRDQSGHFPFSFRSLLRQQNRSPGDRQELSRQIGVEWREQISKTLDLFPTVRVWSLDSHHHVHVIPWIWEIMLKLAREFSIAEIRIPRDDFFKFIRPGTFFFRPGLGNRLRVRLINHLILCNFYHKLYTPLFIGGLYFQGEMHRFPLLPLQDTLNQAEEEIELLFHPGDESPVSPDDHLANPRFYGHQNRQKELKMLLEARGSGTQRLVRSPF
jgi:hypothetical protein